MDPCIYSCTYEQNMSLNILLSGVCGIAQKHTQVWAFVQSLGIQLNLGPSTVLNKTTLNIDIALVFGLVFASNYIGRWIYSLEGVRRLWQKFWVELIC